MNDNIASAAINPHIESIACMLICTVLMCMIELWWMDTIVIINAFLFEMLDLEVAVIQQPMLW